jgi:hypothetical protein
MPDSKPNEFSEYFKTVSNAELLRIIENPENYQTNAVDTAKMEYADRNLSEMELEEARNILNEEKKVKEEKKEKRRDIENKAKSVAIDISETIMPTRISTFSTGKIINVISLTFGVIFIYRLIIDLRGIHYYFYKFSLGIFWYVEPLLILSLAIFFFWQRVRIGWILLMFFVIYSFISEVSMIYWYLKTRGNAISRFLPRVSPEGLIIQSVFLMSTILVLCRRDIREVFKIDRRRMINTIIISGVLAIILMIFID